MCAGANCLGTSKPPEGGGSGTIYTNVLQGHMGEGDFRDVFERDNWRRRFMHTAKATRESDLPLSAKFIKQPINAKLHSGASRTGGAHAWHKPRSCTTFTTLKATIILLL